MPEAHGTWRRKDEGVVIKDREGGKMRETLQSVAPPLTLGKKLSLRWGLGVPGDSQGSGGKGIIKISRLVWCGEQTYLWRKSLQAKKIFKQSSFHIPLIFYWAYMMCQAPHRQRVEHEGQGSYSCGAHTLVQKTDNSTSHWLQVWHVSQNRRYKRLLEHLNLKEHFDLVRKWGKSPRMSFQGKHGVE